MNGWDRHSTRDEYDVAQVCLNGHGINAHSKGEPENNKKFCGKCGQATIDACPKCKGTIRGYPPNVGGVFTPPAYCTNCGEPFPWTSEKINAAIEFAIEAGELKKDEAQVFSDSLPDLVKSTPRAQVAAFRIKKLLSGMPEVVAEAARKMVVDVLSETAKKMFFPEKP
jgi:hypothetical protein